MRLEADNYLDNCEWCDMGESVLLFLNANYVFVCVPRSYLSVSVFVRVCVCVFVWSQMIA